MEALKLVRTVNSKSWLVLVLPTHQLLPRSFLFNRDRARTQLRPPARTQLLKPARTLFLPLARTQLLPPARTQLLQQARTQFLPLARTQLLPPEEIGVEMPPRKYE